MRFILVSPKNRTAYNFRGDLIKRIISCGYEVIVTGPNRVGVEKIEALGARFVEIPMNKNGVNPKEDLKYQKALCELFKKGKARCCSRVHIEARNIRLHSRKKSRRSAQGRHDNGARLCVYRAD